MKVFRSSISKALDEARTWRRVAPILYASSARLSLFRQSLRDSRESMRDSRDAMIARLLTLESTFDDRASTILAEWDAVVATRTSSEEKLVALRLLFVVLVNNYLRRLDASSRAAPLKEQGVKMGISIEISPGELLDRCTILEIKLERIKNDDKLRNVRHELDATLKLIALSLVPDDRTRSLSEALKAVNEELWVIEDDIRECERNGDFGPAFVALARSVYRQNDRRAALKREINEHLGSEIVEEKSYAAY